MEYRAPDQKRFVVKAEEGDGLIRHVALNPLIASEIAAAAGKDHYDSATTPANHAFDLVGEQQVGSYPSFVPQRFPNGETSICLKAKYGFNPVIFGKSDSFYGASSNATKEGGGPPNERIYSIRQ